jgi:hypothetical protein
VRTRLLLTAAGCTGLAALVTHRLLFAVSCMSFLLAALATARKNKHT